MVNDFNCESVSKLRGSFPLGSPPKIGFDTVVTAPKLSPLVRGLLSPDNGGARRG